ncbi:MAG: hypothetical protein K0U93_15220 [Gammaproteobacteria bacterium]|nr:hypothetical protein [Gammaproteobacteria bacterium]
MFDEILLGSEGNWKSIGVDEFLALPLTARVAHLLAGDIEFRRAGNVVPTPQALKEIASLSG